MTIRSRGTRIFTSRLHLIWIGFNYLLIFAPIVEHVSTVAIVSRILRPYSLISFPLHTTTISSLDWSAIRCTSIVASLLDIYIFSFSWKQLLIFRNNAPDFHYTTEYLSRTYSQCKMQLVLRYCNNGTFKNKRFSGLL